ncbi:MAG: hypothetical protein RL741_1018 [Actinomycetota bacterium]|jgi:hypothetical protein
MSNQRANRALGLVVAAISIVALIAVLAFKETTPQLDANTPEGTVQQYLQSVTTRDFDSAITYLAIDTKCKIEDFDQAYFQDSIRISLSDTSITGDSASVKVSIENSNGDPFGGAYTESQAFRLTKSDSGWKISGIPWPTYQCGGEFK